MTTYYISWFSKFDREYRYQALNNKEHYLTTLALLKAQGHTIVMSGQNYIPARRNYANL